jgi:uncharacterized protein YndB with AHSA1/START domain
MSDSSASQELELRTLLAAPRERVFHLMTDPAELAKWFGPKGVTMTEAAVDLRVGGAYRFTMQPPAGAPFHISGMFLELQRPSHIVYTFGYEEPTPDDRETTVDLHLDDAGRGTSVSLSQGRFAIEERRALHERGWTDSFERLRSALSESS